MGMRVFCCATALRDFLQRNDQPFTAGAGCCVIDRTMRVLVFTVGAKPSQGRWRNQSQKSDIPTTNSAKPFVKLFCVAHRGRREGENHTVSHMKRKTHGGDFSSTKASGTKNVMAQQNIIAENVHWTGFPYHKCLRAPWKNQGFFSDTKSRKITILPHQAP